MNRAAATRPMLLHDFAPALHSSSIDYTDDIWYDDGAPLPDVFEDPVDVFGHATMDVDAEDLTSQRVRVIQFFRYAVENGVSLHDRMEAIIQTMDTVAEVSNPAEREILLRTVKEILDDSRSFYPASLS